MTIEQTDDKASFSEEDYWARIAAYNADGTYAYPPPPINADQVFDFWMHVPVPDHVLDEVRSRDRARHSAMEERIYLLHTNLRAIRVHTLLHGNVQRWLPSLSPERLQREVDALAKRRKYRRHPELLEETQSMKDLRLAIQQTNEIRSSVPPRLIPDEQIRMAARLGCLMFNGNGLQQSELDALWGFEVVFMGERQSIRRAYDVWRPDLIV